MVYIKMTTLLASLLLFCLAAGTLYAQNPGRAEWMAGRYGMMTHWFVYPDLALPDASQEERTRWFNEQVDRFDTKTLMKQFDESGADWLIFTLAQGNGYFNSANAFLDKEFPGHTPERDLGMEIAKEVKKRGKRFILYLAGQVNGCDKMCSGIEEAFCWKTGEDNSENTAFENRICALFEAYSRKYGRLCDGWWIDGVYGNHHKGKWHFDKWFAAFRAGNPQSAVALSDAGFCMGILTNLCPGNDYFAGETHLIENGYIRIDPLVGAAEDYGDGKRFYRENGKVRAQGRRPEYFAPAVQYIDGAQLHSLLALDLSFSSMPHEWVSYPEEELLSFAQNMKNAKGGLTINVPNDYGRIPQKSLDKLIYLKEHLK